MWWLPYGFALLEGGPAEAGEAEQQRSQLQGATGKTAEMLPAIWLLHCRGEGGAD
jgi:hypothetical protein